MGSAPAGAPSQISDKKLTIWFSNPSYTSSTRWQNFDTPYFEKAVKAFDPNATVLATNANGVTTQQVSQAESAITAGATVFVVNTIQSDSMAPAVLEANKLHIPVIAYDGMMENSKIQFYVSFDAEKVGEQQAQYLVDNLKPGSTVALINGEQTCSSCIAFKVGAHKVLDPLFKSGKLKLGYEADTPAWLPATAQTEAEAALTKTHDNIQGILAANDGLAGGVIAALTSQKMNGKVLVTGQDATLAGVQDILLGDQTMTIYKNFNLEATAAAKAAVELGTGTGTGDPQTTVNNGTTDVPSILLNPESVTKSNIAKTVVADNYLTKAQICAGLPAAKCTPVTETPVALTKVRSAADPLLQLEDIRKSYGSVEALRGVSLSVASGEVVALVGDNGAGKSTLIKVVAGVHQPDSGVIRVSGEPVAFPTPQAATAAGVATVYQDLALCDNLDVISNLYLGRELITSRRRWGGHFLASGRMVAEGRRVLDELAIKLPSLRAPVGGLSGGQRQAIAVARALLWGSKAVLLDEPTAALGVEQTAMVLGIVRRLSQRNIGVLIVSHNLAEIFSIADRVVVVRQGRNAGDFLPARTAPDAVVAAITGSNTVLSGMSGQPGRPS